jgi:hypothetical protein
MADFIDPATGEIFLSVHTPEGEARGWLKNPAGLESVLNVPAIYRVVANGDVHAADEAERAVIDAKRLPQIKAAKRAEVVEWLASEILAAEADKTAAAVDAFAAECKAVLAAVDAAQTANEINAVKTLGEVDAVIK